MEPPPPNRDRVKNGVTSLPKLEELNLDQSYNLSKSGFKEIHKISENTLKIKA